MNTDRQKNEEKPRGKEAVCRALVQAAVGLIAAQGVGVTTREIAEAAGVNQGLITRYFGTKQVLLREVARQVATQMFDEVLRSSAGLEDLFVTGLPGQTETLRALIQILFDPELSQEGVALAELQAQFSAWLRRQSGFGGREGEPDMAARVFLVASLVLGSQLVMSSTRAGLPAGTSLEDLRRRAFGLFMNGFQRE